MILKDKVKEIKEGWFDKHIATIQKLDDDTTVIHWGRPNGGCYWIRYILSGGFISVMGDCGEAIYQLTEKADLEKIARGYDLSYMTRKLACSRYEKYSFNSCEAIKALREWADELRECDDLTEEKEEVILKLISEAKECVSKEHWAYILARNEDEISQVECEWYEWMPGIGDELDMSLIAYWLGLKMVGKQLGYETKYID